MQSVFVFKHESKSYRYELERETETFNNLKKIWENHKSDLDLGGRRFYCNGNKIKDNKKLIGKIFIYNLYI